MTTEKQERSIALDAMGGDLGPNEVVNAAAMAMASKDSPDSITLVGNQDIIEPLLSEYKLDKDNRISIFHAPEIIEMHEKPIESLKKKKNSSLVKSIELVKNGKCNAAVSCGNTGSLLACSTLKLRTMKGIERPALGTRWPSREGNFVLLDAGGNPSPRPEHLAQNAILGSGFCRSVINIENPKIGLLSIGTEETKGHELIQSAHDSLKKLDGIINYQGLIEGFDVFEGKVDVVVCDGFTGNVLLKSCEGLFKMLKDMLTSEIKSSPISMAGALLMKGAFGNLKAKLNPNQYAGAPLLGLNGNIVKSHGSSDKEAIRSAIHVACDFIGNDFNKRAHKDIAQANERLKA